MVYYSIRRISVYYLTDSVWRTVYGVQCTAYAVHCTSDNMQRYLSGAVTQHTLRQLVILGFLLLPLILVVMLCVVVVVVVVFLVAVVLSIHIGTSVTEHWKKNTSVIGSTVESTSE